MDRSPPGRSFERRSSSTLRAFEKTANGFPRPTRSWKKSPSNHLRRRDHHAVPPRVFGGVEAFVGGLEEGFGDGAVGGVEGGADADGDRGAVRRLGERL